MLSDPSPSLQVKADFHWAYKRALFKNAGGNGVAPAKKEIEKAIQQIMKPGNVPEGATNDSVVSDAEAAVKAIKQRQEGPAAWPGVLGELLGKHKQELEQYEEQYLEKRQRLVKEQHDELLQAKKDQFEDKK